MQVGRNVSRGSPRTSKMPWLSPKPPFFSSSVKSAFLISCWEKYDMVCFPERAIGPYFQKGAMKNIICWPPGALLSTTECNYAQNLYICWLRCSLFSLWEQGYVMVWLFLCGALAINPSKGAGAQCSIHHAPLQPCKCSNCHFWRLSYHFPVECRFMLMSKG